MIPAELTTQQKSRVYANEADVLNIALFGKTAKEWREKNPDKKGKGKGKSTRQYICRHARILRDEEHLKVRIKEDDLLMAVANVIYFAVKLQKEEPKKVGLENSIEQKTSGVGGNPEIEKRKLMELYEKYNSGYISKEFFLSEKRAIQK